MRLNPEPKTQNPEPRTQNPNTTVIKSMNHFLKNIGPKRKAPLFLIAGPCVIETYDITYQVAQTLAELTHKLNIPFIFKASFDKANRTALMPSGGLAWMRGLKSSKK